MLLAVGWMSMSSPHHQPRLPRSLLCRTILLQPLCAWQCFRSWSGALQVPTASLAVDMAPATRSLATARVRVVQLVSVIGAGLRVLTAKLGTAVPTAPFDAQHLLRSLVAPFAAVL